MASEFIKTNKNVGIDVSNDVGDLTYQKCENKKLNKEKIKRCIFLVAETKERGGFFNFCSPFSSNFLPSSVSCRRSSFRDLLHFRLFVLLLLLFEQFVDLPLGHAGVLVDDAVLVQSGQQQQEAHDQVGEEQVVHLLSDPGHGQQTADH